MPITLEFARPAAKRASLIFLLIGLPIILALMILTRSYLLLIGAAAFTFLVLALYYRAYEFLLILILAINEQFFYLLPRELIGRYSYQALLFLVLLILGFMGMFIEKKYGDVQFKPIVISLILMNLIGVLNSFLHGQPLGFSLKAGLVYLLIIFYFIFNSREIDQKKLFNLMTIIGTVLTLLNNLQYAFYRSLKIFDFTHEMERGEHLRFFMPEMFLIFSGIMVFSAYLTYQKKIYLLVSLYIMGSIIVQGQTRIHIWGLFVTIFGLLIFSKRITLLKAFSLGVPILILLIWALPLLWSTTFGRLYELTKYELSSNEGSIAVREKTYDYYFRETLKSPLIGRGIWNDLFDIYMGDNPEDMKYRGMYLSDVGVMSLFFHFGLLGLLWLVWFASKVIKIMAASYRGSKPGVSYACTGYFLFGLATMPTLNCLTRQDSIIYLALFLALFSQNSDSYSLEVPAQK